MAQQSTRSRSPAPAGSAASQLGWAPLRRDAPGRRPRTRGAFPALDTVEACDAALEAADRDIYAASSIAPHESRVKLIHKAMALWVWSPWPPSAAKVRALGTVLKEGDYISAAAYFSAYRVTAERRGMSFDDPSVRALKGYKRSAEKGDGSRPASHGTPIRTPRRSARRQQRVGAPSAQCPQRIPSSSALGSWHARLNSPVRVPLW